MEFSSLRLSVSVDDCSNSEFENGYKCMTDEQLSQKDISLKISAGESFPVYAKAVVMGTSERSTHAYYLPIRKSDLATRDRWCLPGGVFAKYSDGVGRLLPLEACPRESIVVYAFYPATSKPHPDPDHPNDYVQVVEVSCSSLHPDLSHSISVPVSLCLPLSLSLCLPLSVSLSVSLSLSLSLSLSSFSLLSVSIAPSLPASLSLS
jgi:hypothetical protein